MTGRPAVFLDRDGVLNENVERDGHAVSPARLEDFHLAGDAVEATTRLRDSGYLLVVVSNQPDVARGKVEVAALDAMHERLRAELRVDAVHYCPHENVDRCACRKPSPGLLDGAVEDLAIDRGASWMIGDRWVDIAAGRAAGVRTVLLERPGSWASTSAGGPPDDLQPDFVARTLTGCVDVVLGGRA